MICIVRDGLREIFIRPSKNNPTLDGIRALAILYVIIFHTFFFLQYGFAERAQFLTFIESLPSFMVWVWHGDLGVDMFFVLSGFLIGQHLIEELKNSGQIQLRRFYKKRILRIIPLYSLGLLLFALANAKNREYFWTNLLFINNLIPAEKIFIPWSWSLTIEGQFYFLIPWILLLLWKTRLWVPGLVAMVLVAITYRYFSLLSAPQLYTQTPVDFFLNQDQAAAILYVEKLYIDFLPRMGPLFLGVLSAYLLTLRNQRLIHWLQTHPKWVNGLVLSGLALILWVVSYDSYIPSSSSQFSNTQRFWHTVVDRNVFALGVALLMMSSLQDVGFGRSIRGFLSARGFVPIAQTSYSLYLFHPPFLFLGYFLVFGSGKIASATLWLTLLIFVLGLAGVFAFATLTYIFVERPFMRWGREKKLPPAASQVESAELTATHS